MKYDLTYTECIHTRSDGVRLTVNRWDSYDRPGLCYFVVSQWRADPTSAGLAGPNHVDRSEYFQQWNYKDAKRVALARFEALKSEVS